VLDFIAFDFAFFRQPKQKTVDGPYEKSHCGERNVDHNVAGLGIAGLQHVENVQHDLQDDYVNGKNVHPLDVGRETLFFELGGVFLGNVRKYVPEKIYRELAACVFFHEACLRPARDSCLQCTTNAASGNPRICAPLAEYG